MMSTTDHELGAQRSYVRQLIRAFAVLGVGVAIVVPLILYWTSWQQAQRFSEATAQELAGILARDGRYALLVGSRHDAEALVAGLLKFPDLIRVTLIDAEGRVLADQTATQARPPRWVDQVEAAVTAREQSPGAALGAATDQETALGRAILTLSLERAADFALATARASALQVGILTLFLGAVALRLALRMLAPLGTLVRCLGGAVEAPLPNPPSGSPAEVHQIYRAIAGMRARLAANKRELLNYANHLENRVEARTRELRAARDAAEQANRAKTLFLANVSHELRTPLQAIILHARLLERSHPGKAREQLEVILRASGQLLDLIEQLLNLSKVEAGYPLEITYQTFPLSELLDEVAATLNATLAPRNCLEVARLEAEVTLVSDRSRLTQVLYNLIRNADKFMDGGTISLTLTLSEEGEQVVIRVADQGIGIPQAELTRIFDPFYQGSGGVTGSVSSGIGLGLWLTCRILEALGGGIRATSEPGVGSCFEVAIPLLPTIPIQPNAQVAPNTTSSVPVGNRPSGCRLLLAEDEATIRAPLAAFLREAQFQVDECADGTAAMELLRSRASDYAVVILDHRLPGHLGVDILAALREAGRHTLPVVILTGDDRAPLQAAIARLGGHLMVKPILPERLIATVATLIDPPASGIPRGSEAR
jgi:signal transduction histidine kinase/CheY-like chemotaxis protein